MEEKIQISKGLKIKWDGIFDFNDLYRKMKFWLEWKGYGNEKGLEKSYIERIKPGGKQVEIKWVGKNEVSSFCDAIIEVTFFAIGIEKAEVEKEGKMIKTKKGVIEIRVTSYLVLDVKNKFFDRIYRKFVLKNEIESYKIDLYDDTLGFNDEIKAYLTMQEF